MASALGATALQATLVSVAFSVTGISAKIDKAATKVFGKDLVMLGNVLGAGYAMFNGGFDIGGTPDPTAMNVPTGAEAGDLFQSQMAAQGIAPTSVNTDAFNLSEMSAAPLTEDAWNAMGAENSQYLADSGIVDMTTGLPGNVDAKVAPTTPETAAAQAPTAQQPQATGAASAQAAAPTTTASSATAGNATASNATAPKATSAPVSVVKPPAAAGAQPNVFEKMLYARDQAGNLIKDSAGNYVMSDRTTGGLLQGVGGAVGSYMTSQQQQKALDWQKQKYGARIGGRVTG